MFLLIPLWHQYRDHKLFFTFTSFPLKFYATFSPQKSFKTKTKTKTVTKVASQRKTKNSWWWWTTWSRQWSKKKQNKNKCNSTHFRLSLPPTQEESQRGRGEEATWCLQVPSGAFRCHDEAWHHWHWGDGPTALLKLYSLAWIHLNADTSGLKSTRLPQHRQVSFLFRCFLRNVRSSGVLFSFIDQCHAIILSTVHWWITSGDLTKGAPVTFTAAWSNWSLEAKNSVED